MEIHDFSSVLLREEKNSVIKSSTLAGLNLLFFFFFPMVSRTRESTLQLRIVKIFPLLFSPFFFLLLLNI